MQIKVRSAILCDDARKELSGKDILIGVYTGRITVPAYPSLMAATVWIEMDTPEPGQLDGALRLTAPSGNPPIEVPFVMSITDPSSTVIVIGGLPLALERDGEIVISLRSGDQPYEDIRRVQVTRAIAHDG